MMAVKHIVLFSFKPDTSAEVIQKTCDDMLGLKDKCVHPTTQKPYIRVPSVGGKDNSIEGLQDGITHAFIVEFDSVEDRDYYAKKDPAHLAFVEGVLKVVTKAQVVDFTPGVF